MGPAADHTADHTFSMHFAHTLQNKIHKFGNILSFLAKLHTRLIHALGRKEQGILINVGCSESFC